MTEQEKLIKELEEECGHQYKPEEVLFCAIPDKYSDGTPYVNIYITSKKYFEEEGYMDDDRDPYAFIGTLLEEKDYDDVMENTWVTNEEKEDQSIENCKKELEKLGLIYSPEFQKFIEKGKSIDENELMENELPIPDDLKSTYEKLVGLLKENYNLEEKELKELSKVFGSEYLEERWECSEDGLCSMEIYSYEGNLFTMIDEYLDSPVRSFPEDAFRKVLEILDKAITE